MESPGSTWHWPQATQEVREQEGPGSGREWSCPDLLWASADNRCPSSSLQQILKMFKFHWTDIKEIISKANIWEGKEAV